MLFSRAKSGLMPIAFVVGCAVAIAFSSAPAKAQDYPWKQLRFKKIGIFTGTLGFAPVSAKQGILFGIEEPVTSGMKNLVSFRLTSKGKAAKPTKLLQNIGWVWGFDAVWTGGDEGRLFALYFNSGNEFVLATAVFDANGKAKSWKELHKYPSDKGLFNARLGAAPEPDSTAVCYEIVYWSKDSIRTAEVVFFEVDSRGEVIGKLSNLPLDNAGKYQQALVYRPGYNGAWQVPVSNTVYARGAGGTSALNNEVYLYTLSGKAGKRKVSRKKLLEDGQPNVSQAYRSLWFTPAPGGQAPAGGSLNLFIQHFIIIPEEERVDLLFRNEYSLVEIGANGSPVGGYKDVPITAWQPSLAPPYSNQLDRLSNLVTTYGGAATPAYQDRLFLSQAQTVMRWDAAGNAYDSQVRLDLLAIDPRTGGVSNLGSRTLESGAYAFFPHIAWMGNNLIVLNELIEGSVSTVFFSSFHPLLRRKPQGAAGAVAGRAWRRRLARPPRMGYCFIEGKAGTVSHPLRAGHAPCGKSRESPSPGQFLSLSIGRNKDIPRQQA